MSDFQSISEILRSMTCKPRLLPVSSSAMSTDDILHWGRHHNYPRLVLSPDDVLGAGERNWEELVESNDYTRIVGVSQRIERWKQLEQGEQHGRNL
jgi:hypothetical protein